MKKRVKDSDAPAAPGGWDRDDVGYYADQRRRRSRKKGIVIALVSVACAIGVALVGVFAWAMGIQASLNEGVDQELRDTLVDTSGTPEDAFYMLLLGVDKNQDRAQSAEYGADDSNYRSDSIILARIDPRDKQVTLVSLHRDLLIDMGEHGENKLNSAYSFGGPPYVVEVVSELAGVPISHYAEVNFDEFDALVDAIGGIEVDVPIDIDDPMAGAPIAAGVQTLDGAQALTLCRARHAYDDYGDGDLYRAANQRMVIAAIAKKIVALDPVTMAATVSQLAEMVTTDYSLPDLLTLANEMRGIDFTTNIYTGMTPTTSYYVDETWYELLDTDAWKTMMMRVDQGLSPYSDSQEDPTLGLAGVGTNNVKNGDGGDALTFDTTTPSSPESNGIDTADITVDVLNGTAISGLANRVASTLDSLGYQTTTGNANNQYDHSVIAYMDSANAQAAQAVADSLGGQIAVEDWTGVYEAPCDVVLVLGPDMAGSVDLL